MTAPRDDPQTPDEVFRAAIAGKMSDAVRVRQFLRRLPSSPRCKQCNAPFGLPGSIYSRLIGRGPWPKNPRFCSKCYTYLRKTGVGGAEVMLTILFADVRGSTGLAERLGPSSFTQRINRFYRRTSEAMLDADGLVDKFVGDGVVGLFIPALTGPAHASKAVEAARTILRLNADADGLPVGLGIHTGVAFVGSVGEGGEVDDFTALGDSVNAASRLGDVAAAGEALVSLAAAEAASLEVESLERRHLLLKGRQEPLDVVVLRSE